MLPVGFSHNLFSPAVELSPLATYWNPFWVIDERRGIASLINPPPLFLQRMKEWKMQQMNLDSDKTYSFHMFYTLICKAT